MFSSTLTAQNRFSLIYIYTYTVLPRFDVTRFSLILLVPNRFLIIKELRKAINSYGDYIDLCLKKNGMNRNFHCSEKKPTPYLRDLNALLQYFGKNYIDKSLFDIQVLS